MDAHAISDISCRLTWIPECARDLDVHVLNIDASFRRFAVEVVAKTCCKRGEQQFASIDT